jgi:hypothetical protein
MTEHNGYLVEFSVDMETFPMPAEMTALDVQNAEVICRDAIANISEIGDCIRSGVRSLFDAGFFPEDAIGDSEDPPADRGGPYMMRLSGVRGAFRFDIVGADGVSHAVVIERSKLRRRMNEHARSFSEFVRKEGQGNNLKKLLYAFEQERAFSHQACANALADQFRYAGWHAGQEVCYRMFTLLHMLMEFPSPEGKPASARGDAPRVG